MNTYLRKIKKNTKALSPVVASIILIAVTVAVSVVVAAWMGGMTIGLMGNAENVKITNVAFANETSAALTIQNNGANSVTINSLTVGNTAITTVVVDPTSAVSSTGLAVVAKGQTITISFNLSSGTFTDGAQYNFQLITAKGNTVTYTATYQAGPSL